MNRIYILLFISIFSLTASAQVFWTENFGSGCNLGQLASAYTGVNGAWTVASTGTNETDGNLWFINSRVVNTGIGNCGAGSDQACGAIPNPNLHIGGCAFALLGVPADSASYWTGYFCSLFAFCNATNLRAQSPVINCTGKNNITLAFTYYYGGDLTKAGTNGCATLMYNDGSGWVLLDSINKTTRCPGLTFGVWTAYSISLPASANGNPNVRIGINWSNDDTDTGTDPSVAVDDITLSSGAGALPPVAAFTTSDSTHACAPLCIINFTDQSTNNPTSWLWTFQGAIPSSSTMQNPQGICYDTAGSYPVKLWVSNSGGSDSITLTNYINVIAAPKTPSISVSHDTLFCTIDTSYTSYQWYDTTTMIPGATNYYYKFTQSGNYNIRVANRFGCEVAVGINITGIEDYFFNNRVSIFPSPASAELTITGNWQLSNAELSVYNNLGKKVREEIVKLDDRLILNVKDLSKGIYFLQIDNDKGSWRGQFVKD